MTRYMNDFDFAFAARRFDPAVTPNRVAVLEILARLRDWTNATSDGWAYWAPPRRAANTAMGLVASTTNEANDAQERLDATDAVTKRALAPLKAFLTRCQRADMMSEADAFYILTGEVPRDPGLEEDERIIRKFNDDDRSMGA